MPRRGRRQGRAGAGLGPETCAPHRLRGRRAAGAFKRLSSSAPGKRNVAKRDNLRRPARPDGPRRPGATAGRGRGCGHPPLARACQIGQHPLAKSVVGSYFAPREDESIPMPNTQPVPQPGILEIDAYVPGESSVAGELKPIKLSSNETPLGPSAAAIAAYKAAADVLALYPD